MKFEHTEVFNFEGAIRGMRNPRNSWPKIDSSYEDFVNVNEVKYPIGKYLIGENDLHLAQSLIKAGSEHRKFMRQIFVSVDITAPAYWWAELDTYKVGVTRNSTSMQHRAKSRPFLFEDFELDGTVDQFFFCTILTELNRLRILYTETGDYSYFRAIRQILPSSYLYTSTVTMTYENVYSMIQQRKTHKLTEWSVDFTGWAKELPYAKELLFVEV